MDKGQLFSINGTIYEYSRYDRYLDVHFASEIEIDEDGKLTHTYTPCCFSNEEFILSENGTNFTKDQWYGIVEHFIRQDYDLTEEAIADATEDIVGRCFVYGIPKIHELADYIAEYMNR